MNWTGMFMGIFFSDCEDDISYNDDTSNEDDLPLPDPMNPSELYGPCE